MKKRHIVVAFILVMAMVATACGSSKQTLEGKWIGTLDLTKQFEDGIKAANPDLEKYVAFENLIFQMDISFVEGQMEMSVKQESMEYFDANFAEGMKNIAVEYWKDGLAEFHMSLEEAITESGMTEEEYMNRIYKETGIDKMIESMSGITEKTLEKLSNMRGTYTTPVNNELRLYYTEDDYESMGYKFKDKQLNITIKGDSFTLLIECEKNQ